MNKNTKKAIEKRLSNYREYGHRFYIGEYLYRVDNERVLRREERPGRTPMTDWELVGWVYNDSFEEV